MAESTLIPENQKLVDQGEDDLLAIIDLYKEGDDADSKDRTSLALIEILRRHERYLFGVAQHVAKNFPLLDHEVVYSEFAVRLVNHAGRFTFERGSSRSFEKQFLLQAGKFIEYIVKEEIAKSSSERLDECFVLNQSDPAESEISSRAVELREIMEDVLTEKERRVLWAWSLVIPLDGGQPRTSSSELDELANSLETTKVNLRKIRSRAISKIKAAAPHLNISE